MEKKNNKMHLVDHFEEGKKLMSGQILKMEYMRKNAEEILEYYNIYGETPDGSDGESIKQLIRILDAIDSLPNYEKNFFILYSACGYVSSHMITYLDSVENSRGKSYSRNCKTLRVIVSKIKKKIKAYVDNYN